MRIGVISDTHLSDSTAHLPPDIVREFKRLDMIVHAGDIGGGHILEELKLLCPQVHAVWGNMDPDELRGSLPAKVVFKAGNFKIAVTHGCGSPFHLKEYVTEFFKNDNPDVIIFGHSHAPLNEKKDNILLFNPGSPTDKIFAPYNTYGILEITDTVQARIIRL